MYNYITISYDMFALSLYLVAQCFLALHRLGKQMAGSVPEKDTPRNCPLHQGCLR